MKQKKNKLDKETIEKKIEQEERYQQAKHKELYYKDFLKSSQWEKRWNLIEQSKKRVERLKEKLHEYTKK